MTKPTLANGVFPMLHAFNDDTCTEEQASQSLGGGQE
jgi:hypothetical protein